MQRIIITVFSGVAEVDQSTVPKGSEIEIRDYDTQCIENVKNDENGDLYNETLWSRVE